MSLKNIVILLIVAFMGIGLGKFIGKRVEANACIERMSYTNAPPVVATFFCTGQLPPDIQFR